MTERKAKKLIGITGLVRLIMVVLFLTVVFVGLAQAHRPDDFGAWLSAAMERSLSSRWSVGAATELRTKNNSRDINRWQLTVDNGYRVGKMLKVGAGYEFHLKNCGVEGHTRLLPQHRVMFDITPACRVSRWLKLSLRERYQYEYITPSGREGASHGSLLRSMLKGEIFRGRMNWFPFASVELFNNMDRHLALDEIRMAAGTVFHLGAHYSIRLGYLLNLKKTTGKSRQTTHVLTLGLGL